MPKIDADGYSMPDVDMATISRMTDKEFKVIPPADVERKIRERDELFARIDRIAESEKQD